MSEIEIYQDCEIVWQTRNDCIIDCTESWQQLDSFAWQLVAKIHRAKALYGDEILLEIAAHRHGSVHTLRNLSSLWKNPAREKAIELDLSPGHVNVVAGIASDNPEQAEDYLLTAAERGLSVAALRKHVQGSGSQILSSGFRQSICLNESDTVSVVLAKLHQTFGEDWMNVFYARIRIGAVL